MKAKRKSVIASGLVALVLGLSSCVDGISPEIREIQGTYAAQSYNNNKLPFEVFSGIKYDESLTKEVVVADTLWISQNSYIRKTVSKLSFTDIETNFRINARIEKISRGDVSRINEDSIELNDLNRGGYFWVVQREDMGFTLKSHESAIDSSRIRNPYINVMHFLTDNPNNEIFYTPSMN